MRQLVEDVSGSAVHVKVLPSYEQLIHGELTVQPRPVEIDDLLHRNPVRLDPEGIRKGSTAACSWSPAVAGASARRSAGNC